MSVSDTNLVSPIEFIVQLNDPIEALFPDEIDLIINSVSLEESYDNEDVVVFVEYTDYNDDKYVRLKEELCRFELNENFHTIDLIITPEMKPVFSISCNSKVKFVGKIGPTGSFDEIDEDTDDFLK